MLIPSNVVYINVEINLHSVDAMLNSSIQLVSKEEFLEHELRTRALECNYVAAKKKTAVKNKIRTQNNKINTYSLYRSRDSSRVN